MAKETPSVMPPNSRISAGQQAAADAEDNLAIAGERGGDIVGGHEEGADEQARRTAHGRAGPGRRSRSSAATVPMIGQRDPQGDDFADDQVDGADQQREDRDFTEAAAFEADEQLSSQAYARHDAAGVLQQVQRRRRRDQVGTLAESPI